MRLFTLFMFIGLGALAGKTYSDKIMAKVNGHIITNYDIQELSYREEMRLSQIFKGPTLQKRIYELRHRALDMLIEEQLIIDHFNNNDAYQVPSSLLEERIEKSIARRFGSNRDKFYDMLNQKNMTVEEYRKEVERGIILELMRMEFVRKKIVVTPHDIALYYAENKEKFAEPSKMHIKLIIVNKSKPSFQSKIDSIKLKLTNGEKFDELMSLSDSQFSGYLGFLKISDIRPDFLESLKDKKAGEYITIEEESQTLFVQLAGLKQMETPKLEDVHSKIKSQLQSEQEKRFNTEFIDGLKKAAKIEKYVK